MGWSYTRQVKAELAQSRLPGTKCLWAELRGLSDGGDGPVDGRRVWLTAYTAPVARRAYRVMKGLDLSPTMELRRRPGRIQFRLWGLDGQPSGGSGASLCPAGYLRGIFLARGYVSEPGRLAHLEITALSPETARDVLAALGALGIRGKEMPRRRGYAVYLKDRGQMARFLAAIGAHRAVLELESLDVVRSVKNQVNRLVNSETANLRRTVESGTWQAERLRQLAEGALWRDLPEGLQSIARLRLDHPDWSLAEIGLAHTPPLTKSAVNHRMRKLMRWADGG